MSSSLYVSLSQEVVCNNEVRTNIKDHIEEHHFYIGNESLSVNLTAIEATNYYIILSLALTLGEKYWHNFCETGGTIRLRYEFYDFINRNIKLINRDINLEKIIEE